MKILESRWWGLVYFVWLWSTMVLTHFLYTGEKVGQSFSLATLLWLAFFLVVIAVFSNKKNIQTLESAYDIIVIPLAGLFFMFSMGMSGIDLGNRDLIIVAIVGFYVVWLYGWTRYQVYSEVQKVESKNRKILKNLFTVLFHTLSKDHSYISDTSDKGRALHRSKAMSLFILLLVTFLLGLIMYYRLVVNAPL